MPSSGKHRFSFRSRALAVSSLEVGFQHILQHHSLRIKERAVQCYRMMHDVHETIAVAIKERHDDLLQLVIQRRGVAGGTVAGIGGDIAAVAQRPAGDPFDATLDPPAVEDAEAGDAVENE